jgi:outer membrane protein TolC
VDQAKTREQVAAQAQGQLYFALINLYKALGGG